MNKLVPLQLALNSTLDILFDGTLVTAWLCYGTLANVNVIIIIIIKVEDYTYI